MNAPELRAAGAVVLLILGIWAGAWVYSSHGPGRRGQEPVSSELQEITAGPLPPRRIPDHLPAFSLADKAGNTTSIRAFAGKSLIINFWATWCAPCRREIPLLESLNSEWRARGVTVIGVAVDYRDKVLEFARLLDIQYPLLIGEQDALDVAAAFGVESPVFPFTVFSDDRGDVVAVFVGELKRPQAEIILSVVEKLNKKVFDVKHARTAIAEAISAL